ncbi:MAG: SMI1/KNR4 family protein [Lacipirellulaceae bacterium]
MNSASFFFDDGQSRKFWSYKLRGKKQTIRHGRLGTQGRETAKTFTSPSAAKEATEKLKEQKLAKGYVKVDPSLLKIKRPKGKRAATEAQVAKLEKKLGVKLPQEYRDFLRAQNGGEPDPNHVELPIFGKQDTRPVDFIYGLYAKPEAYKSLLFAEEFITPSLPEGHLPICGQFNLYYYSISLLDKPGCVYFWNEDAGGYDLNEHGDPVFDKSHAILVAGSFNEFLTRIAICLQPA